MFYEIIDIFVKQSFNSYFEFQSIEWIQTLFSILYSFSMKATHFSLLYFSAEIQETMSEKITE